MTSLVPVPARSECLRRELLDLRDDPDVAPDRCAYVFEEYVRVACGEGRRPDVLPTVWFRARTPEQTT